MQLMTMKSAQWMAHSPYIDTVLLPVFSISFEKKMIETDMDKYRLLERTALDIEKKLTGRLLLLPSILYSGGNPDKLVNYLEEIINNFCDSDFQYVVILLSKEHEVLTERVRKMQRSYVFCIEPGTKDGDEITTVISEGISQIWGV